MSVELDGRCCSQCVAVTAEKPCLDPESWKHEVVCASRPWAVLACFCREKAAVWVAEL